MATGLEGLLQPQGGANIPPELLALFMGLNDFGGGVDDQAGNQYAPYDQALNFNQDIFKALGIDLRDVLGFAPPPEDPGDAPLPTVKAAELASTWGQNPVMKEAFDLLAGGADPATVMRGVAGQVEADPTLASMLPPVLEKTPGSTDTFDAAATFKILQDYAKEHQEAAASDVNYQNELAQWQDKADAYVQYNAPQTRWDVEGGDLMSEEALRGLAEKRMDVLGAGDRHNLKDQSGERVPLWARGLGSQGISGRNVTGSGEPSGYGGFSKRGPGERPVPARRAPARQAPARVGRTGQPAPTHPALVQDPDAYAPVFDPQVEQAAQQYAQMMAPSSPSSGAAATPAGGPSASGAFRNSAGLVAGPAAVNPLLAAERTVANGLPSPAGRMGGGLVRDIPIPEEPDLPFGAPRPFPSAPPMGEGVPPMGEGVPAMGVGVAPYGSTTPPMGTGVPRMGEGVPRFGSTTTPMVAPVDAATEAAIQALAGGRALRSGPRGGRSQNVTAPSQFANQGSNQAEWLANLRGGLEAKMRSQARPSQKQNEMTSGMQALLSMFMGRPAV